METIAGSPYVQLQFDKDGNLEHGSSQAVDAALAADQVEDLVVLSHGWKFEGEEPRQLYDELWPKVAAKLARDSTKVVVVGVAWPSTRYTTGIDAQTLRAAAEGGALAVDGGGDDQQDLPDQELQDALDRAVDTFTTDVAPELREAARRYREDQSLVNAEALLTVVAERASLGTTDPELADEAERFQRSLDDVGHTMAVFANPPELVPGPEAGGTLGLGVGQVLRGIFRGPRAALVRLLENASYFEMKERAGKVGASLGTVLSGVAPTRPTRLHLVGHSFGARLVTSAAESFESSDTLDLFSITLLQGAFSHNGLSASRGGAYHTVIGKPSGPIVITHTHNDSACTLAYALASRLSRDTVSRIGDASDEFGSMGANGAQFLDPPATLVTAAAAFSPKRKAVMNVRADSFITDPDAHNNIKTDTVGALIAAVIEAPPA